MATWMNESEIDRALEIIKDHAPQYAPYAQYLSDWRDEVANTSDGWPYWKAGTGCAAKLMDAIQQVISKIRGDHALTEFPTEEQFKKAIGLVKAGATRLQRKAPTLNEAPIASPSP
jgi:hypothetical protein